MDDSPVPDLFCSEILSDLDDITSYYLDQIKSNVSFEEAPSDYGSINNDFQNVPDQEPSLLETWVETWESHTEPDIPKTLSFSFSSDTDLIDEVDAISNNEAHTELSSDEYQSSDLSVDADTFPTTSQVWVVEKLVGQTPADSQVRQIQTEDIPTSILSDEHEDLSSSDLHDATENEETNESPALSGLVTNQEPVTIHEEECEEDPTEIQDHSATSETDQVFVPDTSTNSGEDDMLHFSEEAFEHPEENTVSSPSHHAANTQVVPNLQTLLLAHHSNDNCEDEDEVDIVLHFHESPVSPLNPASDSQVVPLWDMEE